MTESIAGVVLAVAYALLWRHPAIKGRRLRAERARAARAAFALDMWARHYVGMAVVHRPDQFVIVSGS